MRLKAQTSFEAIFALIIVLFFIFSILTVLKTDNNFIKALIFAENKSKTEKCAFIADSIFANSVSAKSANGCFYDLNLFYLKKAQSVPYSFSIQTGRGKKELIFVEKTKHYQ